MLVSKQYFHCNNFVSQLLHTHAHTRPQAQHSQTHPYVGFKGDVAQVDVYIQFSFTFSCLCQSHIVTFVLYTCL